MIYFFGLKVCVIAIKHFSAINMFRQFHFNPFKVMMAHRGLFKCQKLFEKKKTIHFEKFFPAILTV